MRFCERLAAKVRRRLRSAEQKQWREGERIHTIVPCFEKLYLVRPILAVDDEKDERSAPRQAAEPFSQLPDLAGRVEHIISVLGLGR
jgi:hypothetical protein